MDRLIGTDLRSIAFVAGALNNTAQESVEDLREASRALGKMFGRATRWLLAPVELALERPVAPLGTHAYLLGLEAIQMARLAFREGLDAIRFHAPQPFGGRGLLT
jgi:hypothetical protein